MQSLTYQIHWKIKSLIKQLTEENKQETLQELDILLNMNPDESRSIILSSLLDEIDLKEIRTSSRVPQKILLFQEELTKTIKRPNCTNAICQAFDNCTRPFAEEYLEFLCQLLRLSPIQVVAVAFSLTQSKRPTLAMVANHLLRGYLPNVNVNPSIELTEDTLISLVNYIVHNKELSQPEISGKFLNIIRSAQASHNLNPVSRMDKLETENLLRSIQETDLGSRMPNRTIASLIMEKGSYCTTSKEIFRATLKEAGIPLTEDQVAGIIVSLVNRLSGFNSETAEDMSKWNLDAMMDVLSSETRALSLNWTAVAHFLDLPYLNARSEAIILFIFKVFLRISGIPVPAAGLVGNWSNKAAQIALLTVAANLPRNIVDFSGIVSAEQQLPPEVPMPSNFSWMSLPLYSTLFQLANSGFGHEVLEALANAATNFPEYVIISLAQVQDPTSGVRAEILRRVLPFFSGLPGSKPSSMVVMRKLSTVNPDLLVLLFRIALKRANKVQDIVEIDMRIKNFGPAIAKRLEDEAGIDENLGYWCVKADRSDFNLEGRISSLLELNPQHARSLLNFIKSHSDNLRPRIADGGLLSFDSFATILRILQNYTSIVSMDELRALAQMMSHQHMQQQQQQQQQQQMQGHPHMPGGMAHEMGAGVGAGDRGNAGPDADEIDEEANAYFQKIYTSDITIPEVIALLKRFKTSTEKREQEIFRCMIHNLFDEYRFFHKYPDKELHLTGNLFGSLIQNQLVSSITLGIALRYVLEALRKDPEHLGSNEKMFRFGKLALEQFRSRLIEWPQYCSHLIQIPHLSRHCPDLFQEAQRALNNPAPGAVPGATPTSGSLTTSGAEFVPGSMSVEPIISSVPVQVPTDINLPRVSDIKPAVMPPVENVESIQPKDGEGSEQTSTGVSSKLAAIERMVIINVDLPNINLPPQQVRDKMHMIINNIDKNNCDTKSLELKSLLIPDYYNWFVNYLVVKRISAQPNLHPLYMNLVQILDNIELNKIILDSTYYNATNLLVSPKITQSSTERTLLRNLGIWLGLMTLARNKPLLHRRMEVKELLFWGYETGRLIAVCSFVARILEGVRESIVFKPPNPWLMGVLSVMRELYEIDDLKMNIKFEVQVLCKNINIKIEDIPKTTSLSTCKPPAKDSRNPDFNIKSIAANAVANAAAVATPPTMPISNMASMTPPIVPNNGIAGLSPQVSGFNNSTLAPPLSLPRQASDDDLSQQNSALLKSQSAPTEVSTSALPPAVNPAANAAVLQEQTVIPNLSSFITINPSLQYFVQNPAQRKLVSIAVDRAIRELIQPVAERSVTIASVTTKQLITKDFATEPNEQQLRRNAQMMTANLAASLALVTCKEPLRLSICNHLRSLLSQTMSDQAAIEQIVSVCSADNLEIGCKLIEKAATEKAIRDCDESLSAAYQLRRKNRELGQPFADLTIPKGTKYPRELPDALKPRLGGLTAQQLQLYEGFQRQRASPAPAGVASTTAAPGATPGASLLSMAQATESYQAILARIDVALRTLQTQLQGREVNLAMLGTDHEIISSIREIFAVTQRIQPAARNETSLTFAENIFKRLLESLGTLDVLKVEVFVAILEALKDTSAANAAPGAAVQKKLSVEMVSWLNSYSTFNANDANTQKMLRLVLVLLLRSKFLRSQDIDSYFASYMDAGRNMIWVELALSFVKQCLAEGLAATYEFANIFDTVSKIRPNNVAVRKHLQKLLTDLRTMSTNKDDQNKLAGAVAGLGGAPVPPSTPSPSASVTAGSSLGVLTLTSTVDPTVREHISFLLEKWIRVASIMNETYFSQYLQMLQQYGVLKTEEVTDRFFRIATEICIDACLKSATSTEGQSTNQPSTISYTVIDALSKFFIWLMRYAEKESNGDLTMKMNLLGRILQTILRVLVDDHEAKMNAVNAAVASGSTAGVAMFDQRPYYRLFSNINNELVQPIDVKKETNPALLPILSTFTQVYLLIQPVTVPGFAFAWMQLVSQRSFLPLLLMLKGQKGWSLIHRLLLSLLGFLAPHLKQGVLTDPIRKIYKATVRLFLLLVHDAPEFLCECQLTLCDAIPSNCVQLRNLVLGAFPRYIKLPDPFSPNLKVDLLPEVSQAPRLLAEYFNQLDSRGLRARLDTYMTSRQPPELLAVLPRACMSSSSTGSPEVLNVPLLNAIIVYVGSAGALQLQNKLPLTSSPAMDLYKALLSGLDVEGRNHALNLMANQLRYPNSHTQFFSYVMLLLFLEADNEFLQEMITRILLDRLIVCKPQPWGVMITFVELMRNSRYGLLMKNFTRALPDIEKVFDSIARSWSQVINLPEPSGSVHKL